MFLCSKEILGGQFQQKLSMGLVKCFLIVVDLQILMICRPALLLPGASKPVVAVRFCPKAFSLRGTTACKFIN